MEEADEFIKEACGHLECSFAYNDEIEFSTPQIFEFLVRCIWKIDAKSKTVIPSYVYPNVITARLHLGNTISTYLQKFHIRGDTALHTVLYGNINNLRSAFIELIRKLPVDSSDGASQDQGQQFLGAVFDNLESQPEWVPAYCRGLNETQKWILPNNEPELLPLFKSQKYPADPRKWISQYINSSGADHIPTSKPSKPALPPKPVFGGEQIQQDSIEGQTFLSEETDENVHLQSIFDQKLDEYKELQRKRFNVEDGIRSLQKKLSDIDPELIEAIDNPDVYVETLVEKILKLNKQVEDDTELLENRNQEAAKKKLARAAELKKMGVHSEELKRVAEMQSALEGIDERIEDNIAMAEKLKERVARIDENAWRKIYDFEKRSKDLDEMVRKQEDEMFKMQEERATLRKQEERDNETVNRAFAIIYNILLQHCDHYRGRLAMESFTRIHLYSMEILEMLRNNGTMKQIVLLLQSEIDIEEQKQYQKQFELLTQDFQEMSNLNEELFSQIRLQNPDFKMPLAE
ncbi:hypothetical protein L3Y34_011892 [Caenorhabditis briggsae]|uniref:CCDC22 N-terminal domain-containing protein n=1 Tax=Caenorhabditis briggsae TaxID=6238 RepID=A0AAE8ZQ06_CAEBR|nr:hypothetical protein L3Y34_011892 [Caenorhabditis briggsae]